MSDATRAPHDWDLVLIGCGKRKQLEQARAFAMYTGPVFAAHLAVVEHLGLEMPHVLSAKHGALPAGAFVDPYDLTLADLSAADLARWNDQVLALVARTAAEILSGRARVRYVQDPAYNLPIKERRSAFLPLAKSFAFGPPIQPAVLVLAGAPYVDGWAGRARALGVRVDDPLRGLELGERRTLARRFVAETPRWEPGVAPEDVGWTRREQLLSFIEAMQSEVPAFPEDWSIEDAPAESTLGQMDLFSRSAA